MSVTAKRAVEEERGIGVKRLRRWNPIASVAALLTVANLLLAPTAALAHCDGLDGPVIKAARKALETGDVKVVLIWVKMADEAEIRSAFDRTLAVRKLSPRAGELAERYFFETLVRIHRAGEGAPYTGLRPAGYDVGPIIPAGDRALVDGSSEALIALMANRMREGIVSRFQEVVAASKYAKGDVTAGRNYVKAYVDYIHYVEQLYEAAKGPVAGHTHEAAAAHPQGNNVSRSSAGPVHGVPGVSRSAP